MKKDTIISIANFHRFALGACPLIFSLFVVLPIVLSIGVSSVLAFFSIERVSVDSSGNQGNGDCSGWGGISADGRYVAFESSASNLVPGDTNGTWDIFVRDRQTNTNTIVSIDCSGNQADGGGLEAIISADGRYVAFQSNATNLVPGDTNGAGDVFVRDLQANTTTRISVDSSGNQGNRDSDHPSISADGRYVAYESYASNLVPGDTNGAWDIFVRDLQANTTTRISVDSSGNQGNSFSGQASISADGNHVAFFSRATNLVPGDTNGHDDIFVRDRQTNTNTIVSVDSSGNQGNNDSFLPSISADGRCVAFDSYASNLVPGVTNGQADIFVRDRQANTITIVSVDSSGNQGNRESYYPSISADGRYVAFQSNASNLVPEDTNNASDIFVRDRQANTTTRVSVDSSGNQGNDASAEVSISADGRYVVFQSNASNLVPGDTNSNLDVFVAVLLPLPTVAISSINPNEGTQSQTLNNVIIKGANFTGAIGVSFGDGITINSFHVDSDAQINVNITIALGATPGVRNVSVSTPSGTGILTGGFTVNATPPPLPPPPPTPPTTQPLQNPLIGTGAPTSHGSFIASTTTTTQSVLLPNIQIQDASLSASKVSPGAPITATDNIANRGNVNGSMKIKLYINGEEDSSQGVTVESGGNRPVYFTISRNQPGTYAVYIGGTQAGSFTVDDAIDPNMVLFISCALIAFSLILGMVYILRRRAYNY